MRVPNFGSSKRYHLADSLGATASENDKWMPLEWGEEKGRSGANLMLVHLALIRHLESCQVAYRISRPISSCR